MNVSHLGVRKVEQFTTYVTYMPFLLPGLTVMFSVCGEVMCFSDILRLHLRFDEIVLVGG